MLFFQLDFILLFIPSLLMTLALFRFLRLDEYMPWLAIVWSLIFLYLSSLISLFVAMISLLFNFVLAKYFLRNRNQIVLMSAVLFNLLILVYFKYSIFLGQIFVGNNSSWFWRLALPLGISFYTFQQIAFLADVYNRKISGFTFKNYILFKLYFPQFVAGPITHYGRVAASYERWPTFNHRSIVFGLMLFGMGMIKKLVGDYFSIISDAGFNNQDQLTMYRAWISMLAFTFQIYFDFSGYSDMAVGVARVFGVSLPYNFNSPYKSISLSDFWRRWHITLSQWLRDYLYIPLGGNRFGKINNMVALFLTMLLGGVWHGANWTFVLWGSVHGVALILARNVKIRLPVFIDKFLIFLFVALTWILFRSGSFDGAMSHYESLMSFHNLGLGVEVQRVLNIILPFVLIDSTINNSSQLAEVFALISAYILCVNMPNSRRIAIGVVARRIQFGSSWLIPILLFVIIVTSVAFVAPDTKNAFIYFEF